MTSLPFSYSDFHGGFNTLAAPYLLTDDEARDLSNVQGTPAGAIVKRNGLTTLFATTNPPTSLFALESITPSVLIEVDGGTMHSISATGVGATIKSGLTAPFRWEFVSAPVVSGQGPLFGMNGVDLPQQWSGTGSTATWSNASGAVAVPNGKFCVYHQNQVFVAGVAASPSRLFWSAIADPTNWDAGSLTGAGSMDFDPNDGQAISALGTVGPYLLVCKPRKMWIMVDPAGPLTRRLSDAVGCVAHRSLCAGSEGTYFLSEDRGVYVTNGSKLTPISDKIQPTLDAVALGQRSQAAGVYFNAHYYLSIQQGAVANDTVLDYDAKLGSWWKHSFGSNQFQVWHQGGDAQLYSAKATDKIVDRCFVPGVFQDNGTSFPWVWRGPWQSPSFYRRRRFPTPWYRKRLRQVRLDGTGTVDFSLAKDFALSETPLALNVLAQGLDTSAFAGAGTFAASDGSLFGGIPSLTRARINSLGVANAFSLVFSATSATQDMVTSYALLITDRKDGIVA